MAFFPCIYFEAMQANYYAMQTNNLRCKTKKEKYEIVINRIKNRETYYIILYKLFAICDIRELRLIVENPATKPHYLFYTQNFFQPTFIDTDRSRRGDCFKKPTAYWFVNCKHTTGFSYQKPKEKKTINQCNSSKTVGVCSEERSMISPDYARNFICDFILGKEQKNSQLTLF